MRRWPHGVIVHPPMVTILSTVAAAVFLKERLSAHHIAGTALVIDGIETPNCRCPWMSDLNKQLLLSGKTVGKSPQSGAARLHPKLETTAVHQLLELRLGWFGSALGVSERHGS
jgi:hypothetical protein